MKAPITNLQKQKQRYLRLLAEKYPTKESVYSNLIHLQASLSLPKGVEHFLSDLHGEYELFYHIFNNCSGVIKEKVDYVFGARLTDEEKAEFCTLIYYPKEKIEQMRDKRRNNPEWYRESLARFLEVVKLMSYKYPLDKVNSFVPKRYRSVIMELLNTHPEADHAQFIYHKRLLNMIVQVDGASDCMIALTILIKRLAVDHMHIVGDFFDRGNRPDAIMEMVMNYPSIDIQWGNHDVMWMGAACGSDVCIAGVVRNSLRYNNTDVLEKGYAISLRPLSLFAHRIYPDESPLKASEKAMSMIMFKLEGQLIKRNPDFHMDSRLLLEYIDHKTSCFKKDGKKYELSSAYFPTIDPKNPYELTKEEAAIMEHLKSFFIESEPLRRHVDYLYKHGSVYTCFNGNLLFHGCVPLNKDGSFKEVTFDGKKYKGRAYLDFVDQLARKAQSGKDQRALDFMWFLWSGLLSPISGREFRTFERMFLVDESTWKEPADPYYKLINKEEVCEKILEEFGLDPEEGHIINGHVPVKVKKGETPVKANGKAIVIDGGFCRAYHNKTGISGYTLISNSRGLRLLEHQTVADVKEALKNNKDIESVSETLELQSKNTSVGDTDEGKIIQEEITDLYNLLTAYQNGTLKPKD
ncbi:MAG: fructose-1,6-bisphosphatase [Anaerovibrio sp.]|uniref:fructose-1,6-bisphosphatase n=1 Tax=Anaerovibrio sp. TaxID=1872532 RepID=UPI001B19E52D|nr:fructose-1,6-bisphosphatase [Anaerovibrio sp.]MBO6246775.1 fructose-1,6-bisphosphatase [Anaerovibrio sp.]